MSSRGRVIAIALGFLMGATAVTGCSLSGPDVRTGSGAEHHSPGQPTHRMDPRLTGPKAHYVYTFRSACGERAGLGTFRVTVRHGEVVGVRGVDRYDRQTEQRDLIPTLDGFLKLAEQAHRTGADELRVSWKEGHPTELSIDYLRNAIDDELCWFATDVRT